MEGIESIAKTLAAEDEDIWMELQYFRDHNHCKEVYAKMMKDKSIEPLGIEFFGLITKGKNRRSINDYVHKSQETEL